MKIRNGYISNSSSASFALTKYDGLTQEQIDQIKDHINVAKKIAKEKNYVIENEGTNMEYICPFNFTSKNSDFWKILEYKDKIYGETIMTNFDMEAFLSEIGIDFNFLTFHYD